MNNHDKYRLMELAERLYVSAGDKPPYVTLDLDGSGELIIVVMNKKVKQRIKSILSFFNNELCNIARKD